VSSVDAVDIDPALLQLGVDRHPDRPYDSPLVRRHVNDGRAFLRSSDDRYDLIVLALTDSLTLVTATANLRLESFLFTEEAFASARDHLAPDGVFILYNYYREDWVIARYARTLEDTFGTPPLIRTFPQSFARGAVLAAGAPAARLAVTGGGDGGNIYLASAPRPARDDWPFPYLERPEISAQYLVVLGLVLLFATLAVMGAMRLGGGGGAFSPHFFALGAAFLLLETRSLVTFSLLFGTTWYVNALVFAGVLLSVLLAIAVNARVRFARARWLYASLTVALLVAYLVPPQALLIEPAWVRYLAASAIAFAPVFAANLVFAYSFRDTARADTAFASNLIGSTLGGALEYTALVTGYQQLLLLVAALYLVALLFATRFRVLADTGLTARAPFRVA
ncbi:MAG: spermidine synthase, partial [Chloroflexota bacterium]|nr:spermidine synthase [Chloroflexota bacterium]